MLSLLNYIVNCLDYKYREVSTGNFDLKLTLTFQPYVNRNIQCSTPDNRRAWETLMAFFPANRVKCLITTLSHHQMLSTVVINIAHLRTCSGYSQNSRVQNKLKK